MKRSRRKRAEKVAGYKINMQKCVAFLTLTKKYQKGKKIFLKPFKITSKTNRQKQSELRNKPDQGGERSI